MTWMRPTYLSGSNIFTNQDSDMIENFVGFMDEQITVIPKDYSIFKKECFSIAKSSLNNKIITDDTQKKFMQYLINYNFIELAKLPKKIHSSNLMEIADQKPDVKCWLVSEDDYLNLMEIGNPDKKKIFYLSEIKETKNIRKMNDNLGSIETINKETKAPFLNYLSLLIKSRNINHKKRKLVLIDPYFLTHFNKHIDKPVNDRMNEIDSWDYLDLFMKHCQFACELEILTLPSQVDEKQYKKMDLHSDESKCELEKTLKHHLLQSGKRKGVRKISIAANKGIHDRKMIIDQHLIELGNINKKQERISVHIRSTKEDDLKACEKHNNRARANKTLFEFSLDNIH